jgi:hypothetical protein
MSQCTKDLQKKGVAYPRTCAECGLGPCKRYPLGLPVKAITGNMTADEMLKMMPTDMLLATARNSLSPAFVEKTPETIDDTMDALAKQARVSMAMIAALAGRSK